MKKALKHMQSLLWVSFLMVNFGASLAQAGSYTLFESGQVRPLAMSPNGDYLYAVNTPDNRLEIFQIKNDGLTLIDSVPVGLEPVAVAARNNNEVWVVNHISDSVSIVDVSTRPARVIRTLLVGDEPRDIVFAGTSAFGQRAFISTAHRGQNSPYGPAVMPDDPGEVTQPGTGRADVWVFNAANTGPDSALGGSPLTILSHFTDTPRALAVSTDGSHVYVAGFHTGNQTTTVHDGSVCDGGASVIPCNPAGAVSAPGGLPVPNANDAGAPAPEVGLIVKYDGSKWQDELGRDWSNQVLFNLPDKDVFVIDANAAVPSEVNSFAGVGTVLYNMVAHPSGKIYVSNTEAMNQVRFEGTRSAGSTTSSVIGHLHESRITVIDPATSSVQPRHLNKHINYSVVPSAAGVKDDSLATPNAMAITSDGSTIYVAAFGSSKVGVFSTASIDDNSFTPDSANHITVSGGGPSGLVLDEARNRVYVLTRFDNSVSVLDGTTNTESHHYALYNPEPQSVVDGRPFLYDANFTSSNGEASCSSCHVFADFDSLAWDLGDPEGTVVGNPNVGGVLGGTTPYHPMKGPMTTQSLRGMDNHGPMHWRGDRTVGGGAPGAMDEPGAFKTFNVAFAGLLGNNGPISTADMDKFTDFILQVTYPPNPNRPLNNSKTPKQIAGENFFFNVPSVGGFLTCNQCHVLNPALGFFGGDGRMSFEGGTQDFKTPHLRNMYQKVGMFGVPFMDSLFPTDGIHKGDQIRGFGFIHDGSVADLSTFHQANLFNTTVNEAENLEQFMHAMDSNIMPVVGQQITLDANNLSAVTGRISLLISQANQGNTDLIVKARIGNDVRGWVYQSGSFSPDSIAGATLSESQLIALASGTNTLTYSAMPLGSGNRAGVDRDEDGVLDGDDVCPMIADNQADIDADGVGDACDVCVQVANASQLDTNGDGFGNYCDADLNGDNIVNSLDLGLFKSVFFKSGALDADMNGDNIVNYLDLGLFKQMFFKAPGPSAFNP